VFLYTQQKAGSADDEKEGEQQRTAHAMDLASKPQKLRLPFSRGCCLRRSHEIATTERG
jgi:hypothetical protein